MSPSPFVRSWRAVVATPLVLLVACDGTKPTPIAGVAVPLGLCGHALVVVSNDARYQSSSVGLVAFDGHVLSRAFVSSASAATGLSEPLSGDVTVPTMTTPSGLVFLDRGMGAAVVTFVDPPSGKVLNQIDVGVRTNPQDYVELAAHKAYVSRYDVNTDTGVGGDVAIVDPSKAAPVGSVAIAPAFHVLGAGLFPHPGPMVRTASDVTLLAPIMSASYRNGANSALVHIDPATDAVTTVTTLQGMDGCWALALSPSGKRLAVACAGDWQGTSTPSISSAGVVVVDVASQAVLRTWTAADLMNEPASSSIAFASEDTVLVTTFGSMDAATPDRLLRADLTSGAVTAIATSTSAFDFGDVRCADACGGCFLADADKTHPRLHRFAIDASGALATETDISLGNPSLLPHHFGAY